MNKTGRQPIFEHKLEVFAAKITKNTKENIKIVAEKMNITPSALNRKALETFIKTQAEELGITGIMPDEKPRPRQKDLSYRTDEKDLAV